MTLGMCFGCYVQCMRINYTEISMSLINLYGKLSSTFCGVSLRRCSMMSPFGLLLVYGFLYEE